MSEEPLENTAVETPGAIEAAPADPGPNRPEEVSQRQNPAPDQNVRAVTRVPVSGSVRMCQQGGFPQLGKLLDASNIGLSALVELQMPMGKIYELQVKAFRNGQSFEFTAPALCIQSTLSGRSFRIGFKFGPLSEETTACIATMLR